MNNVEKLIEELSATRAKWLAEIEKLDLAITGLALLRSLNREHDNRQEDLLLAEIGTSIMPRDPRWSQTPMPREVEIELKERAFQASMRSPDVRS